MVAVVIVGAAMFVMWPERKQWNRIYYAYMTIRDKVDGHTYQSQVKIRAKNKRQAKKLCKELGITLDRK